MKNKALRASLIAGSVVVWLIIWQIFASLENNNFLFPDIPSTIKALGEIFASGKFFSTVFTTLLRVLSGLLWGVAIGVVLAVASHHLLPLRCFLTPIISIIKATPVASFIIILWIKMSGSDLSVFIAFLMVMPIIWQNLLDGYDAIDEDLDEVCKIFNFSFFKRLKFLVMPTLFKYFIPALITSTGLAWKAEIAAEIIAYTTQSIGQQINDAKANHESPTVFAWTIIVICLSIILEVIAKALMKRCKKWASN